MPRGQTPDLPGSPRRWPRRHAALEPGTDSAHLGVPPAACVCDLRHHGARPIETDGPGHLRCTDDRSDADGDDVLVLDAAIARAAPKLPPWNRRRPRWA